MLRYAIAYSINDPVGKNVAEKLVERGGGISYCEKAISCYNINGIMLGGFNEDTINFDFLDQTPDENADFIIVVSKHQSTSNTKTLSVHHTGNLSDALYGGKPKQLSYVNPAITKQIFRNYYKNSLELKEYSFTLEATHHGPTSLIKPLLFIEIGSTEKEWNDIKAINSLAQTIIDTISNVDIDYDCIPSIGIGSTHYPKKFTEMELNDKYCFGHIISKHYVDYLDFDLLKQCVEKSNPRIKAAIIEKKGIKSEIRKRIDSIIRELGLEIIYV
ncbi:D-aminoacyl-tRNA deacylase [Caldisphaera sp.]|uniref:D-aminoacyl-tRNA deacylase n=1 Tax=Caldisphaera sp. TaxID=2060322 RepID=UPI0025B8B99F|nr:D-aminoacyl-tRNA deacylase [Caldisphaera sp.]